MGAASSTSSKTPNEVDDLEDKVASMGSLSMLRSSFSKLADPKINSIPSQELERCLGFECKGASIEVEEEKKIELSRCFGSLLSYVGPSIVELFFIKDYPVVTWAQFVKGYLICCQRLAASEALNLLIKVFVLAAQKAGISLGLEVVSFDSNASDYHDQDITSYKLVGELEPADVFKILALCWFMEWDVLFPNTSDSNENLCLPKLNHLVGSAVASCVDGYNHSNFGDLNVLDLRVQIPGEKFTLWILGTIPHLCECFHQFVNSRLRRSCSSLESSSLASSSQASMYSFSDKCNQLLNPGRAWAVSLSLRGPIKAEIMNIFSANEGMEGCSNLLYRSSCQGRGLNRLWASIEGYHGPLLVLVSGSVDSAENSDGKWIIGVLTEKGLENKDSFYGNSGILYAIHPVFNVYHATGKEKNFVYSHMRPSGRVYEVKPKPVGIAFGGTIGNERIFIDEDFGRIVVRHHAVDKTYQPGVVYPNQGYLPVEATLLEVEVWGVGGKASRANQISYRRREELFIEQRRKVDLKTFASWEDAPEKMMLDMMGNPNSVPKEDR